MSPFLLSKRAYQALIKASRSLPTQDAVFAVVLGKDVATGVTKFGIGVYERSSLPEHAQIVTVDGLQFYIDPSIGSQLIGKTVDHDAGRFSLIDARDGSDSHGGMD